ncbi:MAG: hypothetical protein K1X57_19200 [Gemmataceae bacterium]|nr:hypothetical protein [Gemmataceae bacterium]
MAVRLGACAAAIGGAAAITPEAQAGIVTFNTPIAVPQTFAGVYVNLLTGGTSTVSAGSIPGWDFNPYYTGSQIGFFWNNSIAGSSGGVAATTTTLYQDLPNGTVIDGTSTFSNTILATNGSAYLTTGTHILGFRFYNENTSTVNYGYLTMDTTGTSGFPATIQGWSFEDTGAPITVVAVPEPSSLLLSSAALALGARGMRKWRRKGAAA